MSPRALFFFVHCLSEDQLLTFRAWLKKHGRLGKKRPKYLQLFNRMAKMVHFDEAQIRTAPFDNASTYYKARELLLEKLIGCFSTEENPALTYWNYIKTSVRFGAIEIAQHYFQKEYGLIQAQGSESELLTLCRYREQVLRDYKADLGEGLGMVPARVVLQKISWEEQAMELIQATRSVLRKEEPAKAELRRKIAGFLEEHDHECKRPNYYREKLNLGRALLALDFLAAARIQMKMADSILAEEMRIPRIQVIKEIANAVTLALRTRQFESALDYILQLSRIECENEYEENLKNERWMRRAIEFAITVGDGPQLAEGFSALRGRANLFSETNFAMYHYVICVTFFYWERFDEGHNVLRKSLALPRKVKKKLVWQFEVLDLMYHLEKGNLDYIFSVLDTKRKRFRKQLYPSSILKGLDLMMRNGGKIDEALLERLEILEDALPQTFEMDLGRTYFDFFSYVKFRAAQKPLSLLTNWSGGRSLL